MTRILAFHAHPDDCETRRREAARAADAIGARYLFAGLPKCSPLLQELLGDAVRTPG